MKRDKLIQFIEKTIGKELLYKARKKDEHMPNGLQWQGKEEIKKIVLGVSANEDFFKEAVKAGADALIVHHGLGKDLPYNLFSPSLQKRIKILVKNDLSLFGYHYVLDSHPEIGNNAIIIKKLGAKKTNMPLLDEWGWVGEFKKSQKIDDLSKKCSQIFSHDVFVVKAGKEKIKRIGVVSGRGVPFGTEKLELVEKDVDLYITGEVSEWNPHDFKETGISCFACGHYATEVFGVQELGLRIKKEFPKLDVEFIDVFNPL